MSLFRALFVALCICTSVATAQNATAATEAATKTASAATAAKTTQCPLNDSFELHIGSRLQYLEPATGCTGDGHGCYTYFNTTYNPQGYYYKIQEGTTHLMLAAVPPNSTTPVNLYADTLQDPDHPVLDVILNHSPPKNMKCHIRPAPNDDDTCDLVCVGDYKGNVTQGSTILLGQAGHDQWALGHYKGSPKIKVKARF